jgi:hypothetical protein
VQITSGRKFACAIAIDQTLHCWGDEVSGQIPGLFIQVSADSSGEFACGVLTDGSINCFGTSPGFCVFLPPC